MSALRKLAQLRPIFAFHGLDSCLRLAVYILLALLRLPLFALDQARKRAREEVMAIAGIVLGFISLLLLSLS